MRATGLSHALTSSSFAEEPCTAPVALAERDASCDGIRLGPSSAQQRTTQINRTNPMHSFYLSIESPNEQMRS